MPNSVFKKEEIVGCSPNSITDAISNAVAASAKLLPNATWFEVVETRGHITDGKVSQYQVVLKVGGRLEV